MALLEQIETEIYYKIGVRALEDFENNSIYYSAESVLDELENDT